MTDLTFDAKQVAQLLAPINKRRVKLKQGQSHLEAYDVRAHLNRVFGFGAWSSDVIAMDLMFDLPTTIGKDSKPGFAVCYKACVRLTLHATGATYTEWAIGAQSMGERSHGDCHDFAVKTAESQALKRAATNLGDQFGLSLYNGGSLAPLVGITLVGAPQSIAGVDEHITELADETVELSGSESTSTEAASRAVDNGTRDTASNTPADPATFDAAALQAQGEANRGKKSVVIALMKQAAAHPEATVEVDGATVKLGAFLQSCLASKP